MLQHCVSGKKWHYVAAIRVDSVEIIQLILRNMRDRMQLNIDCDM